MLPEEPEELSFLGHLEILRKHIIRSVIAILVLTIIAFLNKEFIVDDILFAAKDPNFITYRAFCYLGQIFQSDELCIQALNFELQSRELTSQFNAHIQISVWAGLIGASPYIIWEFWRFIKPGLHETEQKAISGIVVFLAVLFILGVLFGFFIIMPLSVQFLSSYTISDKILNEIDINSMVSTVMTTTLSTGLAFELPIIIYFLARVGIVSSRFLRLYRRHAIVVILVIAAIITPPDVISQTIVSIPLLLLYEVGIIIAKRVEHQQSSVLLLEK
jgi:sec-independent protein translocase protein TatC